jgi:oligopeptide transport system permease protein
MKYIVKRFIESLITVFLIVSLVFVLMRFLPAEKFFTDDELKLLTNEQVQTILKREGLLDPPLVQLMRFYKQLMKFDLGVSRKIKQDIPVTTLIGEKVGVSMRFGLISLAISMVLGIFFGMIQARYVDKFLDNLGFAYTVIVRAVPGLVVYSLVCFFGAKYLHLPSIYNVERPFKSGIMPVVCLSMGSIAGYMIWIRRYLVDEQNKDYIKLATMKGFTQTEITAKHMLKNAFVPMSQQIPGAILGTIGGSMMVERFFSIPGIGPLLTDAVTLYDVNVVQALVMLYAILGVAGVFLGDLTLTLFDPRVRLGKKEGVR